MAGFASGINWGTAPNAATFTSDIGSATRLATSGSFTKFLTEQIVENSAMIQAGLIVTHPFFNNVTGVLTEVPFFNQLDYIEENVQSSNDWGTAGLGRYNTQKHTASTQYAPIITRGAAFAADMLSQYQVGEDTLGNVAQQLSRKINKDITAKVIAQLTGLFGSALSMNSINVAAAAGETAGPENYISANAVTKAKYLLGENAADMKVLVVHPDVASDLELTGMLTFQNDSGTVNYASNGVGITDTLVKYFAGLRVVVDSQVPKVGPSGGTPGTDDLGYVCYIAQGGVIKTGSQFPMMIKQNEDILSLQDVMSVTYNRCDHVLGTSYGGPMEPANEELAKPENWTLAFGSPENVPIVELIVNASAGRKVPAN